MEKHSDCAENESGDCKKSVLDQHPENPDNSPDDAADESATKACNVGVKAIDKDFSGAMPEYNKGIL